MPKINAYLFFGLIVLFNSCNSKAETKSSKTNKNNRSEKSEIFESEHFQIDLSISGFKHAMTKYGSFTFNENGDYESIDNLSNTIAMGMLPKMSEMERNEFIKSLYPDENNPYEEIKELKIKTTMIDDKQASILNTPYTFDEVEGIMYVAIIDGKELSVSFMGHAYGERKLELLEKYRKTVETIRMK